VIQFGRKRHRLSFFVLVDTVGNYRATFRYLLSRLIGDLVDHLVASALPFLSNPIEKPFQSCLRKMRNRFLHDLCIF
jgi:hypothetical protein